MGKIYDLLVEVQDNGEQADEAKAKLFDLNRNPAMYFLRRYHYVLNPETSSTEERKTLESDISEIEIDDELQRILDRIVSKWDRTKIGQSDKECRKYINSWLKGELKKFYCRKHSISPYYLEYMDAFRKAGLNLWKSDETELVSCIKKFPKHPKDAKRLIDKLRYQFPDPTQNDGSRKRVLSIKELTVLIAEPLDIKPSTATYLLAMDLNGLNIWTSPQDKLIEFLSDYYTKPDRVLVRMRENLEGKDVSNLFWRLHKDYAFPSAVNIPKISDRRPAIKQQKAGKTKANTDLEAEIARKMDLVEETSFPITTCARFLEKELQLRYTDAFFFAAILSRTTLENPDTAYLCAIIRTVNPFIKNPVTSLEKLRRCNFEGVETAFVKFQVLYKEGRIDHNGCIREPRFQFEMNSFIKSHDLVVNLEKGAIAETARSKHISTYYAKWFLLLEANGCSPASDDEELYKTIVALDNKKKQPERLVAYYRALNGIAKHNSDDTGKHLI